MNEQRTVSGRRFFVILSGKTNGAEQEIIAKLRSWGFERVNSIEDCDFVPLFCPVASRVETDINEALSKFQTDKPIILIVMHHTFDPERIIAESRRQVHNTAVILTVDVLFHEGKLLNCNRNNISYYEIKKVLQVPFPQNDSSIIRYMLDHPLKTCVVVFSVGLLIITVVLSVLGSKHKL